MIIYFRSLLHALTNVLSGAKHSRLSLRSLATYLLRAKVGEVEGVKSLEGGRGASHAREVGREGSLGLRDAEMVGNRGRR